MSFPEVLLWNCLRRRSLGLKFRRQHPVPPYIVDFYCPSQRLVVEIDGEAHNRADRPRRDEIRDAFLIERGFKIVRIRAADVLANPEAMAEAIVASAGLPLHHASHGPPPHALHGEELSGASA